MSTIKSVQDIYNDLIDKVIKETQIINTSSTVNIAENELNM